MNLGSYILDTENNPVPKDSLEAWKWKEENPGLATVGQDEVNGVMVSTAFLVIDHGWNGVPQFFETCLFKDFKAWMSPSEVVERYSTFDEAKAGHNEWIEKIKKDGYEFKES